MIRSKKELLYYIKQDRLENDNRNKKNLFSGSFEKKLQIFKIHLRKCEYYTNVHGFGHKILAKYHSVMKNRIGGGLDLVFP